MSSPQHDEWAAVADGFGVDLEQVRRDHLISHVFAAIAEGVATDDLVFFGGTALSRTYLTDAGSARTSTSSRWFRAPTSLHGSRRPFGGAWRGATDVPSGAPR